MKIYVGALSSDMTEKELKSLFQTYGHVTSVYILKESENGQFFFYGLVEMPVKKQALLAIESLDGKKQNGMTLSIHPARMGHRNRRRSGRAGGRRNNDPPDEKKSKK
jgi:RNA recognition motif-containing protein